MRKIKLVLIKMLEFDMSMGVAGSEVLQISHDYITTLRIYFKDTL